MHPLDARSDRKEYAQASMGLGYCNITKCCTEVCPEHIKITDNGIIPMKERVVDRRYDPLVWLGRKIFRRDQLDDASTSAASTTSGVVGVASGIGAASSRTPPQEPAVGPDGKLPLTELTLDKAAAPSPFGDDQTFPLPDEHVSYEHPEPGKDSAPDTSR
jgi:succinate dehydrogenase / fumarate reductase iron-sulfur subunit